MSIYKFPKFRYSPYLLTTSDLKIKLDLEDLGLEEESDIDGFANKHLDKIFVFEYMFEHYDFLRDIKMIKHWNDKYLKAFPESISARINTVNIYDTEFGETTDIFKVTLAKEIDLLFHEKPSDIILNDGDYNSLLYFLVNSFCEIGEIDNAKKIFKYALSFGNQNTIEELAFRIKGIEFDDFMQFNYVSFLMMEKTEIFEWQEEMLAYFYDKRKSLVPHKSSAYTILNKDTLFFSSDDIAQLSEYDNDQILYDDLIWVLYNGLARQFAGEDFFEEHYFFNALMVAAHFRLTIILEDFMTLLADMPFDKEEQLFGDIHDNICTPSLAILGCGNLQPIIDEYEIDISNGQDQINIIAAVSQLDVKESKRAQDYIENTVKDLLEKKDYVTLCYWIFAIIDCNISGYEWLIAIGENEEWIETFILNMRKEGNSEFNFYMTDKSQFDEIKIEVLLNNYKVIHKIINPIESDLDSIIDNIILITNDRIKDNDFIERVDNEEFAIDNLEDLVDFNFDDVLGLKGDIIVNEKNKVGRNSPCPCGSGRKYKVCCLSNN